MLCAHCEAPVGVEGVKAYTFCDLSDGEPCLPCKQHDDLDEQINQLLAQRLVLRAAINNCHDTMVRRLPREIVSTVFEFCVGNHGKENDWSEKDLVSPLTLAAVCQAWRDIAQACPRLWTSIRIVASPEKDSCIYAAQEWLIRSGERPLSFDILFKVSSTREAIDPQGVYYRLISVVNQYSHRWESLHISAWSPNIYPLFCGNSQGAPLLRDMWVLHGGDAPNNPADQCFSVIGMKPRLSRVWLDGLRSKSLDVDWSIATSIDITRTIIPMSEFVELLLQAPRLLDCRIRIGIINADPTSLVVPARRPIIRHGLQTFEFHNSGRFDPVLFLGLFEFPNLTHLKLFYLIDVNMMFWDCFIGLIIRSSAHLISLSLHEHTCTSDSLSRFLYATPFLQELNISIDNVGEELFRLLAGTSESVTAASLTSRVTFLPNLQSIQYNGRIQWDASFWASIPHVVSPHPAIGNPCIRPLSKVSIRVHWISHGSTRREFRSAICNDKHVVSCIVELSKLGIEFDLTYNDMDILEKSARRFRIKTD